MPLYPTLEICANSLQSALIAQKGGADRIELCANLEQGGTTPSAGTIQLVRDKLDVSVFVLIRPRAGDFTYNDMEFESICSDVLFCKEQGCDGVVVGFLDEGGQIDIAKTQKIVQLAAPMQVTFHRAFDCVEDPFLALEKVIEAGCHRILTSGLAPKADLGKELIGELIHHAHGRIAIMAGSGVNHQNVTGLYEYGIREFHASATRILQKDVKGTTLAQSLFYQSITTSHLDTIRLLKEKIDHLQKLYHED